LVGLADVSLDEPDAVFERLVEVPAVPGGEVVEDRHLVAAGDERVDEVRSDEAGSAGYECTHERAILEGVRLLPAVETHRERRKDRRERGRLADREQDLARRRAALE